MPVAALCLPSLAVISLPAPEALSTPDAPVVSESTRPFALSSMILPMWSIGVLVFMVRDVVAHAAIIRWMRRARPLRSARWAALLPTAGDDWSESLRRYALLHERAHIRRRDYLSTRIARVACALHWYNPLVWYAAAQIRNLQEQACDDAVLRSGETASDYAHGLLSIAASASRLPGPRLVAIGMSHRSHLRGRIVAILDPHKARSQPGRIMFLAASVPLVCLALFLGAAAVVAKPDDEHGSKRASASPSVLAEPPVLPELPVLPERPLRPELPILPEPPTLPEPPVAPTHPAFAGSFRL